MSTVKGVRLTTSRNDPTETWVSTPIGMGTVIGRIVKLSTGRWYGETVVGALITVRGKTRKAVAETLRDIDRRNGVVFTIDADDRTRIGCSLT